MQKKTRQEMFTKRLLSHTSQNHISKTAIQASVPILCYITFR